MLLLGLWLGAAVFFGAAVAPALFNVLRGAGLANANELAQARRAYGSSRLTLGLLYAHAGLLKEAELEFRALWKANPDSELAKRLLKQARGKP